MKLPIQPDKYNRTQEQNRSGILEREIAQLRAEIAKLQSQLDDHEDRITALEP